MNPKRLAKKLRREWTANPKKAAVLGLLLLVALYFWAPLVWGWIGGDSSVSTAAAQGSSEEGPAVAAGFPQMLAAAASPDATEDDKEQVPDHPWNRLVQWIEQDPRMTPAMELPTPRDPFVPAGGEAAEATEGGETEVAGAIADATPESLGLVLSSTLIGPRRRTALVNGRAYEQGRTVALSRDGRQLEFTLSEVHPRRIVLKRDGKRYELTIPQSTRSGRLEMYGNAN